MDVCRFDPSQGIERPGSEPMSEPLAAALHKPPPGVQVWSACTAKQYSYESEEIGVFLDALMGFLVMQIFIYHIHETFETIDVEQLTRLKH